jgi:membrane protease YdiL (CAAX protease family)
LLESGGISTTPIVAVIFRRSELRYHIRADPVLEIAIFAAVGAVFVTTLIFALAHVLREDTLIRSYYLGVYHEEVYFAQLFAALLVEAIIRQKAKSLGAACVAHITNNAIATILQ